MFSFSGSLLRFIIYVINSINNNTMSVNNNIINYNI